MTDTLERMTEEKVANGAVVGEAVAEPLVAADGMLKTFPSDPFATPPNFGRTVRVVGEVLPVDTNDMPHPKNQRGELGKALFNWYRNTVAKEPLTRVSAPNHYADKRNYLITAIGSAPKGKVSPKRVPVEDPAAMARHIKRASRHLDADLVGIAPTHPNFLYASGKRFGRYLQEGTAEDSYQHLTP